MNKHIDIVVDERLYESLSRSWPIRDGGFKSPQIPPCRRIDRCEDHLICAGQRYREQPRARKNSNRCTMIKRQANRVGCPVAADAAETERISDELHPATSLMVVTALACLLPA